METPLSDKKFQFSAAINSQYIIDLYAGDYIMIEETFTDVLHEYDAFVTRIVTSFQENDRPALKSAIHKIKPLFGFVGLTSLQAWCLQFENACLNISDTDLAVSFDPLREQLLAARAIIEKERMRLAEFNHS